MANSSESSDGGASELQRGLVESETTPSHGKLQSENNRNHCFFVAGHEDTRRGVVEGSDTYNVVPSNTPEMVVPEQTSAKKQEEVQVKCSEKCALKIEDIDDAALTEPSPLVNDNFNYSVNSTEGNRNLQETKEKKEKKPRRRGGRARKNNDMLNCYSAEKKEKLGHQYSRTMMESLRFEDLEEQKKRWVEVYCGLDPLVAQEYDGLVEFNKIHRKDSVPDIDFDPRRQFQKSAKLGEDCSQVVEDHFENLDVSDPSAFVPISDETTCSIVEEECSQQDDSDDDYSSIQRPVFFVTGEPDFDSGPPQDGLEYLRRVRWETARIPKVTVAKINKIKEQSQYMPQIPGIMQCPEIILPLKQWEHSFLADFSELRLAFARLDLEGSSGSSSIKLEPIEDGDILAQMVEINNSFEKFVTLTSTDVSETSDAKVTPHSPEKSSCRVDLPTLSTILKMDSASRTSMLKRRIRSIESMSSLSHNDSLWVFALCVVVDCPLDADTSAALRSLLRKCASLRAGKTQVDDEVVVLNILVTISGRYFGQLECVEK